MSNKRRARPRYGPGGRTRGPQPMGLVPASHPVLNAPAYQEEPSDEWYELGLRLVATARHQAGLAVAAPQVGRQVALVGTAGGIVLLNPSLSRHVGPEEFKTEGCLSLPGRWFNVRRWRGVTVTGLDPRDGSSLLYEYDELMAQCWQHEIDHLDGILISERWEEIRHVG